MGFFGPGGFARGGNFRPPGGEDTLDSLFGVDLRANYSAVDSNFDYDSGTDVEFWYSTTAPTDQGIALNKLIGNWPQHPGSETFNGQATVEYEASERTDSNGSDFGDMVAAGATILLVTDIITDANDCIFEWAPGTSSQQGITAYAFGGDLLVRFRQADASLRTVTVPITAPTGKMLLEISVTPNDYLRAYINGTEQGTAISITTAANTLDRIWLNSLAGGAAIAEQDVGQLVIIDRPITSDERTSVQSVLETTWGAF